VSFWAANGIAWRFKDFATTGADARAMRFAADYGFKPAGYPYPSGRGYHLVLYLRNAGETKQAVLSDGQTPS
jgi:hypothetical protein